MANGKQGNIVATFVPQYNYMCITHICQCVLHIIVKIFYMKYGNYFKEARKQSGLTQKEVALKWIFANPTLAIGKTTSPAPNTKN